MMCPEHPRGGELELFFRERCLSFGVPGRRVRHGWVVGILAGLSFLAAGCGSSKSPLVVGTTSPNSPAGGTITSTSPSAASNLAQALAYARCMRSHGVPTFPDPNSTGETPKTQVTSASQANPSRFDSAATACRQLAPSGGNGQTQAQIAQDWNEFRAFARGMRSHGVENWPDPSSRSVTDRRPTFNIAAAGLDVNAPQLRANAQQCSSLLHMGHGGHPAAD